MAFLIGLILGGLGVVFASGSLNLIPDMCLGITAFGVCLGQSVNPNFWLGLGLLFLAFVIYWRGAKTDG